MTWLQRICVTWSAAAIAFSLGCAVRGDARSQAELVFHFACIAFHVTIITVTVGRYLRQHTTNQHKLPGGEG